jgi:hypothetical protein
MNTKISRFDCRKLHFCFGIRQHQLLNLVSEVTEKRNTFPNSPRYSVNQQGSKPNSTSLSCTKHTHLNEGNSIMKKLIATTMTSLLTFGSFALTLAPKADALASEFHGTDVLSSPTTFPTSPSLETALSRSNQEMQTASTVVGVCTDYYTDGYGNIYWYSYYCY